MKILKAFNLCILSIIISIVGASKINVAVTGAAGRTGSLLVGKLLKSPDAFTTTAFVRNEKSMKKLYKSLDPSLKDSNIAKNTNIKVLDVTDPESLASSFQGVDKVILCTSAVPQIKKRSNIHL